MAVLECLESMKIACTKSQCIFSSSLLVQVETVMSEIDVFCFLNEYRYFRPHGRS